MDPVGQGSFIPKQSLAAASRPGGMGLLLLLALFVFIVSLVAAGGAFAYQRFLTGTIADKDVSLRKDEGAFSARTIQDLVRTDARLTQAQGLLKKHVSPSAIFSFLSTITLERVQFTEFNLTLNPDGSGQLTLSGIADSFSTVALQSDKFGSTQLLKDVVVSDVAVNDKDDVTFSVHATVDANLLLYSRNLNSTGAPTQ